MAETKKHFELLNYKQLIYAQIEAINLASRTDLTVYINSIDHLERMLTPKLDDEYKNNITAEKNEYAKAMKDCNKERGLTMELNKILYHKKFTELMRLMDRKGWLS
jgi:hypothetical protein